MVEVFGRGTLDIVQAKVGTMGKMESEFWMLVYDNVEQVDVNCSGEGTNN